jgi:hypothetical protein
MFANAVIVSQKFDCKLPLNFTFDELSRFLKWKGFQFNNKNGKFELPKNKNGGAEATWNMRGKDIGVLNSFCGISQSLCEEIQDVIYPYKLTFVSEVRAKEKDLNKIIEALFKNGFEIVSLSINGIYELFVMKDNAVIIHREFDNGFRLKFYGKEKLFYRLFDPASIKK